MTSSLSRRRKTYVGRPDEDDGATLDGLREAVTTLEEIEPIARRVLGSAHPYTRVIESNLRSARATLRTRNLYP